MSLNLTGMTGGGEEREGSAETRGRFIGICSMGGASALVAWLSSPPQCHGHSGGNGNQCNWSWGADVVAGKAQVMTDKAQDDPQIGEFMLKPFHDGRTELSRWDEDGKGVYTEADMAKAGGAWGPGPMPSSYLPGWSRVGLYPTVNDALDAMRVAVKGGKRYSADGKELGVSKFRKKPVIIEAVQWFKAGDHPAVRDVPSAMYDSLSSEVNYRPTDYGWIETLEGGHLVSPADWIIRGVKGELYPCKPDIFSATYDAV